MAKTTPHPVVLCILDGWGLRDATPDNAVAMANTPVFDRLFKNEPHGMIATSGLAVGLPEGQMGNSEVGHMNMGAGRVVMQDLPRIDAALADGTFKDIPNLQNFIRMMKETGGTCHLMGLISPGGVHSHQRHIAAFAKYLDEAGIPVRIHAFLDGRDTPPQSAEKFISEFEDDISSTRNTKIATVSGRYFAMDRDKRWGRVEKAFNAIRFAKGDAHANAQAAIKSGYANGQTDEFVEPCVIADYAGMQDGDGLFMAHFRADRAREILAPFVEADFEDFDCGAPVELAAKLGLTQFSDALAKHLLTLFEADSLQGTLGEYIAEQGLSQLRIAETEKYAHVTFFLNGGREDVFQNEERILVPSPKVATYDLQPTMSAPEITEKLLAAIKSEKFDLIVVNYANPDMVGHTGDLDAAILAVETIDHAVGQLEQALKSAGGVMVVTADHGNIEQMRDPETGAPHTAHTTYDVPIHIVNAAALGKPLDVGNGRLADIAPTVLDLMGLAPTPEMTGHSLIQWNAAKSGPNKDRAD